jgi:hypothetical protein
MDDKLRDVKLFEVPVYRCSPEAFQHEYTERKERYRAIHEYMHPDKEFSYMERRSFRYNEVVGWIVIYANAQRIRVECWMTRERITKYLVGKTYEGKGKLCQFRVRNRQAASAEIFEGIRDRLLKVVSEAPTLAKRWIDLECFESVGSMINWRKVMHLEDRGIAPYPNEKG